MVSLEKKDAQIFYNCQFQAPSFHILAKTLVINSGYSFSNRVIFEKGMKMDCETREVYLYKFE